MAKYRQLYTEFWSDSFVLELTTEEKFFYLYLLTNTKMTQCGIYELSTRFIEKEIGLSNETVQKLINKFCEYKKILYCEETKEIMVLNWMKYNIPKSVNGIKCVQYEMKKIKNKEFLKILFNKYQAAELDVEKIFENFIIEDIYSDPSKINSDPSKINSASVDCVLEKEDEFSTDYSLVDNPNVIYMKVENKEIQTNNNFVKTKEIQEPSSGPISKPFARDLQVIEVRSKK
ncbi:chromosomal replication initiator DnaA [Clostridium algoriphilum]|uniref:chromosomal replication initiator DnaA n=1 Tax=Clostridium algoriphilum TaxID=198347 RepID=UPI001CF3D398|nr:chromosomal replication initiator DnaA [Clostridium algoriphilum]MCB2295769.1 chromosomal replication initiator DnaA [Clostridium algoriphilum]